MTTANVGNRSPCFEPFLHPLQCRNPLVDQIRFVSRAEETVSTTELACVLLAPRPSFVGSEYFNGRFMLGKLCNDDLPQALHVRRALFCRKDGNLFRRHIKPFAIVLVIYILIHCIGRQQLLQVSRVNIGDRGYLFRGTRLTISHGPVNASLITDLGKQASERRARVPDDFAGKRIQTVAMSDVAQVVLEAAEGRLPARSDVDLVAPAPETLQQLIDRLRIWLGFGPATLSIAVPRFAFGIVSWFADLLGHLGWRSPLRTNACLLYTSDAADE